MSNKINNVPQHKTLPSTPATPDSGYAKIYTKSDKLWYGLDDAGVETPLSGGGGGGGTVFGSGTLNYLSKWTPDGVTLGNSKLREDSITAGITSNPLFDNNTKFQVVTDTTGIAIIGSAKHTLTTLIGQVVGVVGSINGNTTYYGQPIGGQFEVANLTGATNHAFGVVGKVNISSSAFVAGAKFEVANNGSGSAHSVVLVDGTETISGGKFLKDTGDGKANWSDLPTASAGTAGVIKIGSGLSINGNGVLSATGGSGSGLSGSGSNPRLARWITSDTLEDSSIRNVGNTVGVNTDAVPGISMYLKADSSHTYGLSIETLSTFTSTAINIEALTPATGDNIGIYIRAENASEDNIGVTSIAKGVGASSSARGYITIASNGGDENIGVDISSTGTGGTSLAYGVKSLVGNGQTSYGLYSAIQTSTDNSNNIAGYFSVNQDSNITTNTAIGIVSRVFPIGPRTSNNAYFAQFTKRGVLSTNTVVRCDNSSGYADWGKVTSSYTDGASGTFTSADGKTITVTNGLITSIV